MSLIQSLPSGPLDIVGDIHGEYDALLQLIGHLGYDHQGKHVQGRTLVFVGDFCDRGPDSPAVLALVQRLVKTGRAAAVLGNHEIDLLLEFPVDGSGWFFDESLWNDHHKYAPFQRANLSQRREILSFLSTLPIGLERDDLRVVHAAWDSSLVNAVRGLSAGSVKMNYERWNMLVQRYVEETRLEQRKDAELVQHGASLHDRSKIPPMLHAHAEYQADLQMMNPLRILTQGGVVRSATPLFTRGRWQFAHRSAWWNAYGDSIPVIFGHFWRSTRVQIDRSLSRVSPDLFHATTPTQWLGKNANAFCIDFSVGGRWAERKYGTRVGLECRLAAMQWPERTLCFDDGMKTSTQGFLQTKG